MTMGFTVTGKNNMLTAVGITHCVPCNGDPSTGGTELAARQAITLAAASGGSRVGDCDPALEFSIAAGQTVNHIGYYNALTGGALIARDDVTAEVYGAAGIYRLTAATFSLSDP